MTDQMRPGYGQHGAAIASNTRTAVHDRDRCVVCEWRIKPGERVADLTSGGIVHVTCIGQTR